MGSYFAVFITAALAAAFFMPILIRLGHRVGVLDDTRLPPIPRVGGWAITLGCAIALLLVSGIFQPTAATLLGTSESVGIVGLGAVAFLILGTIDDVRPLKATTKFAAQTAVSLGVYALGVRVGILSFPFGNVVLGTATGAIVTVVWLVGVANAFNLLDGADGVATGSAFFAATAVFIMSVALDHPAIGLVAAGLAGALLGFLPFNFPPARAFLGDAGSLVVGFLLAGLAVEGSTKGPTLVAIAVPLVAFAVPVFDTTITLLRRLLRGHPVFQRDQEHFHHKLARAGLSPRQVAGVVYASSAAFALAAMLFLNPGVRAYAVVLLILGVSTWFVVRHLRLHELNELARVARRGVLQPRAIAMNVGLRRAAELLEAASSLGDLKEGLAVLFLHSEFDEVLLMVAPGTDRRGATRTWRLHQGTFVPGTPRRGPDEWEVVCPFEGDGWVGELRLRRRLGRRSLILDLNLLIEIVQPALSRAARRIHSEAIRSA